MVFCGDAGPYDSAAMKIVTSPSGCPCTLKLNIVVVVRDERAARIDFTSMVYECVPDGHVHVIRCAYGTLPCLMITGGDSMRIKSPRMLREELLRIS